jgi:toxin ParE1/3/4
VNRRVVFAPEAQEDLLRLYDFIDKRAGPERAQAYTERVASYCAKLEDFPERGTRRDDLRPGLRIIGFERRMTIAFHVTADRVTIDRVFYGGRDWETLLSDRDDTSG